MEPNQNLQGAAPWNLAAWVWRCVKPHSVEEGGGGMPIAQSFAWNLPALSCGPERFSRWRAALWTVLFCCLPQVLNHAVAVLQLDASAPADAVFSCETAPRCGMRVESTWLSGAEWSAFSPSLAAAGAGAAAGGRVGAKIGQLGGGQVPEPFRCGFVRCGRGPYPGCVCDLPEESPPAGKPEDITLGHWRSLSSARTPRRGDSDAGVSASGVSASGVSGCRAFHRVAACGWDAVGGSAFAIRRPKPGRLWNGPVEAWCFFRQATNPWLLFGGSDLEGLEDGDGEAQGPGLGPDEIMPRPVPLLLFLRSLPTIGEVSLYFAEALGQVPVAELGCRIRFERLLVFTWGSSWRRCVLSEGVRGAPGVTLEWWTNDDFGLSELREFFEAPFFRQSESVRFYQWLGEGGTHEADFRGHRLRMSVRKRDGGLFVRIQWWREIAEADGPDALLHPELLGEG